MEPSIPDHKKDELTDSDEEDNVRHDRFRSERSQEEIRRSSKYKEREELYNSNERYNDRRHSGRSSPRYYSSRDSNSSSSYQNEIRRSNHDRKEKGHHHHHHHHHSKKSSKHKPSNVDEYKNIKTNESRKKTLSSILENFDKNLESKRKNLTTEHEIGPVLPPHLKEAIDKELVTSEKSVIGPELPLCSRTKLETSSNEQSDNDCKPVEDTVEGQSKAEHLNVHTTNNEGLIDQIEGPALPPHLKKSLSTDDLISNSILPSTKVDNLDEKNISVTTNSDNCSVSPPEPKIELYGPVLPPAAEKESYGPALPPNFKKDVQGPSLPEGVTADQLETLAQEESEDEDMVGPLPEGKMNMTQFQLDLRASHIKRKLDEEKFGTSKDIKKREEWMLELPPEKASNLGLGPRSFRMREAPDMSDRSSWTDTPADKLRKMEQALSGVPEPVDTEELKRTAFIKERDSAMEKMAQLSRDEDRPQSLLELHQKKLKKKKKKEEKEGKKKERRPFDRNIDLQVNRFDDAQKKAIFKKAQLLDTRFSSGESKFL